MHSRTHHAPTLVVAAAIVISLLPAGEVLAANGSVTIKADSVTGVIGRNFYSTNLDPYMCYAGNVSFYTSATTRTKALAQHFANMRIPGGAEGDGYHWWNGAFDMWQQGPNTVPIKTFNDFAEAAGSKVQCIVNTGYNIAGHNSVTSHIEACNWIEYENGTVPANPDPAWTISSYTGLQTAPAGYFAWLRAQKGHPAPYNVEDWEIGNENYLAANNWANWSRYRDTIRAYYPAMKARAAACGSIPIKVGAQVFGSMWPNDWNDSIVASKCYDALINHWYLYGGTQETQDDANIPIDFGWINSPGTWTKGGNAWNLGQWTNQYLIPIMHNYLTQAEFDSTQLWLTEINVNSSFPTPWEAFNAWSGVWTTRCMAEMMSLPKPYSIFNWYTWCNAGDDTYSEMSSTGSSTVSAAYWAFDILTHWGRGNDQLLPVTGSVANVDVYAAKLANGQPALLVLNKEQTASSTITFSLAGYTPASHWTWWTYGRNEVPWDNTDRAACQTPPTRHDTTGLGSSFSFTFPAMSVNVLQLFPPTAVLPQQARTSVPTSLCRITREGSGFVVNAAQPGEFKIFSLSGELVVKSRLGAGVSRIASPSDNGTYVARWSDAAGHETVATVAGSAR